MLYGKKANRRKIAKAAMAAVTLLSLPSLVAMPAMADLKVCNNSPKKVSVAVGYWKNSSWHTAGWYNAAPHTCVVPVGGSLTSDNYYVYAEGYSDKSLVWSGDTSMCVDPVNVFDIKGYKGCSSAGFKTRKYFKVSTGSYTNYTYNLNYTASPSKADSDAAVGAAVILGTLAVLGWAANENQKSEENACMRRCTRSRQRCVELCTQ
ncbi:hypothetical protein HAD_00995 [Hyphomonas adhaerens MHS-3]|uniref:DUF1036 domain-containing protein n=1 Tax=Hyphomonas adhaerens MHS-3 TaxID=1280949 RepID=A0A069E2W9_9PROT|nr:DUF1036 domain-containing protein [Hyphomonas adhaerens]KCZ84212.1 hypothetical protein HAD_00995 [Hyphomonas adhaerens MHS-3]